MTDGSLPAACPAKVDVPEAKEEADRTAKAEAGQKPPPTKPCNFTQGTLIELILDARHNLDSAAFKAFFFTSVPPGHLQHLTIPDCIVRCIKCGCTIDEHTSHVQLRLHRRQAQVTTKPSAIVREEERPAADELWVSAFLEGLGAEIRSCFSCCGSSCAEPSASCPFICQEAAPCRESTCTGTLQLAFGARHAASLLGWFPHSSVKTKME